MLLTSVFDSDVNKTTRFKAKTVTKTMRLKTQEKFGLKTKTKT